VARLLPPESSAVEVVSREVGVSVATLERWRADALANGAGDRRGGGGQRWTAAARLEAVIATAAMDLHHLLPAGLPAHSDQVLAITTLLHDIAQARTDGARLAPACAQAGVDPRTLQRWSLRRASRAAIAGQRLIARIPRTR
jgi:hypothetical protein